MTYGVATSTTPPRLTMTMPHLSGSTMVAVPTRTTRSARSCRRQQFPASGIGVSSLIVPSWFCQRVETRRTPSPWTAPVISTPHNLARPTTSRSAPLPPPSELT
jgi:hypothetical protein